MWEIDTSSDVSGEVLRNTLDDTREGGETARTAVPFHLRHPDEKFLSFHLTQPKRGGWLLFFTIATREI